MKTTKKCTKCNKEKSLDFFYKRNHFKTKVYFSSCKECCLNANKTYRLNNIEKEKIRYKKYRFLNKKRISEYHKLWRNNNTQKCKQYAKNSALRFKKKYDVTYDKKYVKKHWNNIYKKQLGYRTLRDGGLYQIWLGLISRCRYKSHSNYHYYGGRGIKCEWKSYIDFKKDMLIKFNDHIKMFGKKQTTIDRIDPNGNYSKSNCRWATWEIQRKNTRRNVNNLI